MELRQLTVFVAVAEEGTFTAAARRVGVVQSAVSTAISSLERELGEALFERTTRHVALTDAGTALLPEARTTLAAARTARDAVDAVRGGLRGTVRLGAMHAQVLRPLRLPALLARFRSEHPHVEIRLEHGSTSAEKARQVRDGRLDLALVGLVPPAPPGVAFAALKREAMALVCHRDHRLAGEAAVELATIAGETFVDGPPGSGSRTTTDAAFAAAGLARSVAYEINDTSGMVDLVGASLAVAVLPPVVAIGDDELRCVPIGSGAPVLHVSLVAPANRPLGAAATALAAHIRAGAVART